MANPTYFIATKEEVIKLEEVKEIYIEKISLQVNSLLNEIKKHNTEFAKILEKFKEEHINFMKNEVEEIFTEEEENLVEKLREENVDNKADNLLSIISDYFSSDIHGEKFIKFLLSKDKVKKYISDKFGDCTAKALKMINYADADVAIDIFMHLGNNEYVKKLVGKLELDIDITDIPVKIRDIIMEIIKDELTIVNDYDVNSSWVCDAYKGTLDLTINSITLLSTSRDEIEVIKRKKVYYRTIKTLKSGGNNEPDLIQKLKDTAAMEKWYKPVFFSKAKKTREDREEEINKLRKRLFA